MLTDSLNQLISDEVVCRTAPATPGVLNTYTYQKEKFEDWLSSPAMSNWPSGYNLKLLILKLLM